MRRLFATAVVGLACAAIPLAQTEAPRSGAVQRSVRAAPRAGGSNSALATVVSAFVWDGRNDPVRDITVRLRNAQTGHVEGTTMSDIDGRVTFTDVEGGTYLLEVVNAKGSVLAAGQVFSVMPGETVATFVRLGSKLPWFTGIFNRAAASAVAGAAAIGATAVGVTGQPQSPEK